MGNLCATDSYKDILTKYPDELKKYITGEQIKKSLTQTVGNVGNGVTAAATDIKAQQFGVITNQQNEVQNHYNQIKAQVDKNYPGGVTSLEQAKGRPFDQIVGMNGITQNFDNLKNDLSNKFQDVEVNSKNQLEAIKNENLAKINSESPNIPALSMLDPKTKNDVLQNGLNDHKDFITSHVQNFFTPLQSSLNVQTFADKFKSLFPGAALNNLTSSSKNQLSSAAQGLIGNKANLF